MVQQRVEAATCEIRTFIVDGEPKHMLYTRFLAPSEEGRFNRFERRERPEVVEKWFGGDEAALAHAEQQILKLARRWAYSVKGVEKNCAKVLWASENFHGRTLAIVSASTDPESKGNFGPFMPGFPVVPYNDAAAIETALAADPTISAVLLEPVQGVFLFTVTF